MFLRICQLSLIATFAVVFTACSNNGTPSYNPDIGPFDEDGNYVEAWADNPPKRGSRKRKTTPEPRPEPKPERRIVSKPKVKSKPIVRSRPKPAPVAKPKPKPKPRPVAKAKPKPKPKPIKVKPKTIRHVVQKGETLYSLSRKYGVSVSAIKKANRISGTTIQTGKTYVIPR